MDLFEDTKSYKVFILLLESFKDLFLAYLTNRELGMLDRAITDVNLRKVYLKEASTFYLNNDVESLDELRWIVKRGIPLSKVHLSSLCYELNGKL